MRANRMLLTPLLPWLLLVGSCSSPPKPPTVDESKKRPANAALEVELQVCKSDLQNTRIQDGESRRAAASAAAALQQMSLHLNSLASHRTSEADPAEPASAPRANGVYTIRFDFASTRVNLPAETAAALADEARAAPLVVLRGRTDGANDSPAESWIARQRAAAVRDYLVAAGVDPTRIRATHQPTGDHVADNATAVGRGLNRRVEVEVYRVLPVAMNPVIATQATQQ